MKHSSRPALWILLLALLSAAGCRDTSPTSTGQHIYLFRHAEKEYDTLSQDPALTLEGEQRAANITSLLQDVQVDRIYSTKYVRNMETIYPLAKAQSAEIKPYEWHDWAPMLNEVIAQQLDLRTVVICGHGDNLLPMITYLGCATPLDSLGAYEHDKYFAVKLLPDTCMVEVVHY